MDPTIISPSIGKIVGQTVLFNLSMATRLSKENFDFKSIKIRSQFDFVSHHVRAERLGKYSVSKSMHPINMIIIHNWDKRNGGHLEHVF